MVSCLVCTEEFGVRVSTCPQFSGCCLRFYKQLVEVNNLLIQQSPLSLFSTTEMWAPRFALPSVLNEEKR